MKLRHFYVMMFCIGALPAMLSALLQGLFSEDLWLTIIPQILGMMLGLLLLSSAAAGLVALGCRLFGKRLSIGPHMITFGVVWILVVGSNLKMAAFENTLDELRTTVQATSESEPPASASVLAAASERALDKDWDSAFGIYSTSETELAESFVRDVLAGRIANRHERFKFELPELSIEEVFRECRNWVRGLNAASEMIDRMGDSAAEKVQLMFVNHLNIAMDCAEKLSSRTGYVHTVSRGWFGYEYSLKRTGRQMR